MSEMVSRWPVLISSPLESGDVDDHGRLTETAALRLVGEARDAYLARCRTLDGIDLEVERTTVRLGPAAVTDAVTISTSVTEVYEDAFVMATRIRPASGPGVAADATARLTAGAALGAAVRDEMIAMAHAASHFH